MPTQFRQIILMLPLAAVVLTTTAALRGGEYDEQYTLFVTAGVARPVWPTNVFTAGAVRQLQSGHASFASIARDLRTTDVHPPLYFWAVALWRAIVGPGLFATRLASVVFTLMALIAIGVIATLAEVPVALAMTLTLGCYGFVYTGAIARGFALAQMLTLSGVALLLLAEQRGRGRIALLAGALLGAATFANYLAVFVAGAALLWLMQSVRATREATRQARPQCATPTPVIARSTATKQSRTQCAIRPGLLPPAYALGDSHIDWAEKNSPPPLAGGGWGRGTQPQRTACTPPPPPSRKGRGRILLRRTEKSKMCERRSAYAGVAMTVGAAFAIWLPADLWFFLAQRTSRTGQFPPFHTLPSVARLGQYLAANLFGGLPLYTHGAARTVLETTLATLLLALAALVALRWRRIATPSTRLLFAMAASAPPFGLLLLGLVFNNTPIELRYLAFAMPFIGLLVAGCLTTLPKRPRLATITAMLAIQTAALIGLATRQETMQPARATAAAAAALARDGVVLLPRGNDGAAIVGSFAIEAPPALRLLVVDRADSPATIRARATPYRRVTLALLAQDDASRATLPTMQAAFATPCWHRVADGFNVVTFERICEGE